MVSYVLQTWAQIARKWDGNIWKNCKGDQRGGYYTKCWYVSAYTDHPKMRHGNNWFALLLHSPSTMLHSDVNERANVDLSNEENIMDKDNSQRGVQYQCNPSPLLPQLILIFASRERLRKLKYDRHGVTLISLQRIKVMIMWFLKCKGKVCLCSPFTTSPHWHAS